MSHRIPPARIIRPHRTGQTKPPPSRDPQFMSAHALPEIPKAPRAGKKPVLLIAHGDLRLSANQTCWPEQAKMEEALRTAVEAEGYRRVRAHLYRGEQRHGFIRSQKEGMEVFRGID